MITKPQSNLKSVYAILIKDRFTLADLQLFIFILVLKNKKKDHFIALTKSASIIKELINKNFYLFLNNNITANRKDFSGL